MVKRKWLILVMLLMVLIGSEVQAQDTILSSDNFDFETASVPVEIQPAIVKAISERNSDILTGGTYFIVGTFHQDKEWGYGTIGMAVGNQPPNWNQSIKFIVHKESKIWHLGLEGTLAYKELESHLPSHFPSLSLQSPLADDFKFPWSASQIWCYTSSWHSGWSVDFGHGSREDQPHLDNLGQQR